MSKPNFVDTPHCLLRKHCSTCRNFDGGRGFRQSLFKLFVLPNDDVDFECPYGKKFHDGKAADMDRPAMRAATNTAVDPVPDPAGCSPCARKRALLLKRQQQGG